MDFIFNINDLFDNNNDENDISVFDYTADNTNLMVTGKNLTSNKPLYFQNTKKDCLSFHNCLQYYNTIPNVQSINNVPIENILSDD